MELRHLRYFIAAAETENVSRAALQLHVSQPALSRQIRDLEDELGFRLFERDAKSVHLTGAGRVFLKEARAVLERADQAVAAARAVARSVSAELHVAYAPSPTARILPATLRKFQAALPEVRVKLRDLSTEEMVVGVREGKLHFAMLVNPGRAMLRGLHFEELIRDKMCLAVPPGHSLGSVERVPLAQIAREPLVIFSRREYPEYFEYIKKLFARLKAAPHVAEEHDSASSLIAALESGVGVSILPQSFSCSAGPRLSLIPIVPEPDKLIIGLAWSKASALNAAANQFLQSAREAAPGLK
jgi:DNA-binding transcriptional LysR family regulator